MTERCKFAVNSTWLTRGSTTAFDTRSRARVRRYDGGLMFASAISVNRTGWHFPAARRTSVDNNTTPISPGPLADPRGSFGALTVFPVQSRTSCRQQQCPFE